MEHKQMNGVRPWLATTGAALWILAGTILALRPAGHPPTTFRTSADLMPWLALGLLLIGSTLGPYLLALGRSGSKLLAIAATLLLVGSIAYAFGSLMRNIFLKGVGWEPLMPIGFMVFIGGLSLTGVAIWRVRVLPWLTGFLFMVSGICLLAFNDQYNPWMSLPFGLCMLSIVYLLVLYKPASTR